jgi:hypothetical protein
MKKRKLQIFVSSTYEDLIDHRLAAIEAILAAGHIPAAMEQFSPGDETAWETIRRWIDESDAFILILGRRYGSIEPESGKSYVQLEYEYAKEQKKPFLSLVIKEVDLEQPVKVTLKESNRIDHGKQYSQLRLLVQQRLCGYWQDKKDIKVAIFQKLPEWAQRPDLIGWVPADEIPGPQVTTELARLSEENRELRFRLSREDNFDGLTFEEMADTLRRLQITSSELARFHSSKYSESLTTPNAGHLFEETIDYLSTGQLLKDEQAGVLTHLISLGLVSEENRSFDRAVYKLTTMGRRFRNKLSVIGDRESRLHTLWNKGSVSARLVE